MSGTDQSEQSITVLVEIAAIIFNFTILMASVIFAIFIILTGIKLATSLGDPKKVQSAKNTLIHAFLGFLIVVGFFVIIRMLFFVLGLEQDFSDPTNLFQSLIDGINAFDPIVRQ